MNLRLLRHLTDLKATLKCLRWSLQEALTDLPGNKAKIVLITTWEVLFGPKRYLVFHPGAPYHFEFTLSKILAHLRLRPTTNLARLSTGCPLMVFTNATVFEANLPDNLPEGVKLLNHRATDISKSRVEAVFSRVAGYSSHIDPLTHEGLAVEKSERNAARDGRVISCPLTTLEPDCVYQKLITNVDEQGQAFDIRVPVIAGAVPLLYIIRRPITQRFKVPNTSIELLPPEAVLSPDELAMIGRFAEEFGLDWGELDVLRDTADGKLYIVDANNTPFGPSFRLLPRADYIQAVRILSAAFHKAFF